MRQFCYFPTVSQYLRRTIVKNQLFFTIPWQKTEKRINSRFPGVVNDPALIHCPPCPTPSTHTSRIRATNFTPLRSSFVRSWSQQLFAEYHMSPLGGGEGQRGGEITKSREQRRRKSYPNGKRTSLPPFSLPSFHFCPQIVLCVLHHIAVCINSSVSRFDQLFSWKFLLQFSSCLAAQQL